MNQGKDLLKRLKERATDIGTAEPVKPADPQVTTDSEEPATHTDQIKDNALAAKSKPTPKKRETGHAGSAQGLSSFEELYEILKEEKQGFSFGGKRLVYIDDDLADILELIKKKAKINSNLLTSHLLKKFFLENIGLIKDLKERQKGNKFLG